MMPEDLQPDPSVIGAVSTPPFVVLPDPATLFGARAVRLRSYAAVSPMAPFLNFVADIVDGQHGIVPTLPPVAAPDPQALERARGFEMPPIDRAGVKLDDTLDATLDALFDAAAKVKMPEEAEAALTRVRLADGALRAQMVRDVLAHDMPVETLAEHVYVAAALQVHAARLAATLDSKALVPVGDGVCPACGGPPVASLIVEWPNAHGNRYCACSLCSTLWNYVRIRCCACGSTKGIGYQGIEGGPETIKAETCDECRTYVKVLYQNKDITIEPVADDIGSLGLDMMMREGPYRRAAFNPFLLGY
ncbi:formate dehydrogenase accessory protein FdhE [Ancylobacter sp. SL191]|uniref:formate dehydrogenase accessory protein FdhE n=1 Tax=Ancylobacter sp. SL191 TaxID=2995166 RepID=UPI00226FF5FC|nr:formate dehydrogenase accessory protein FdhE [Ancylobacter sp. SL191]WAC29507.1 formate dehydrogenase accessory protein FdhE [Ancylobacter sp. SL191]